MTNKLRRSNGVVTEKAHLRTNASAYESNFNRIFRKDKPINPKQKTIKVTITGTELEIDGLINDIRYLDNNSSLDCKIDI